MRILVVDDERNLADSIVELLESKGYEAQAVYDGIAAVEQAESHSFDMLILDVMLPGMDGFQVTKTLREEGIDIPILLLTAKGDLEDRIYGLERGADYYLPKPFYTEELLACVKTLLRRQGAIDSRLSYGNTTLALATSILSTPTDSVRLSAREFELMKILLVSQHRNVLKETLLVKVWGYDSNATDNHVEVYISMLRKKLAAIGSDLTIRSIQRQGYHLEVRTL